MVKVSCHGVAATKDHGAVARPSQLIASVRQASGWVKEAPKQGDASRAMRAGQTSSLFVASSAVELGAAHKLKRLSCHGCVGQPAALQTASVVERLALQRGVWRMVLRERRELSGWVLVLATMSVWAVLAGEAFGGTMFPDRAAGATHGAAGTAG